jgi:putative colanic acid biosynthesis acetyltransferase WcaF
MNNVTIGEGAIIGARSAVFKNVEDWTMVGGNPAIFIKKRKINNEQTT